MNVDIWCEMYQHDLLKISVGDAVCGLEEGSRELSEIEKDLFIGFVFWEILHIGNHFPIQIFQIFFPPGQLFRIFAQILAVECRE